MDLFTTASSDVDIVSTTVNAPLAERIRPRTFDDVMGQDHLAGKNGILKIASAAKEIPSFILWGPPGCGKTTIARIVAEESGFHFESFSAVLSGIREVREVMAGAETMKRRTGRRTIVFVDEIHRFNKAQQDAFLPYVERGDIVLIGATTENPSFEIIAALLSRVRVFTLHPIDERLLVSLLRKALESDEILRSKSLNVSEDVLRHLAFRTPGDARAALNLLEAVCNLSLNRQVVTKADIDRAAQQAALLYDKGGEEHFNVISALHKSMRNGDPDAAMYWLARMIESGDDPLYISRRLVRFASEDIGNADPQALVISIAARHAVEFLGLPEGKLALAQAAAYLSLAPKSNALYDGYSKAERDLKDGKVFPVPMAIRNAPTKLMKDLGYGKNYEYVHDTPEQTTALQCLPDALVDAVYYDPKDVGMERELKKRKAWLVETRKKLRSK